VIGDCYLDYGYKKNEYIQVAGFAVTVEESLFCQLRMYFEIVLVMKLVLSFCYSLQVLHLLRF